MPAELIPLEGGQHSVVLVPKATTDLPFFYLTKKQSSLLRDIQYEGQDTEGRPIRWAITPNRSPQIGPPGIEAHEVWMRLVKPVIDYRLNLEDKATYVIPLGKVRECLRTIGWSEGGFEARRFLRALRQIGAAWCIADLWIPTTQKDDNGNVLFAHIKGEFSKMTIYAIGSKHLTAEELNDGRFNFDFDLDDTVYVLLNPIEAEIQKNQPQRYIDNQYMFSVGPAAQRWYELLAPKLFGVIKNKGSYCEVRYSWYIKHHHTLKRFHTRQRVVYQMTRIVQDHLDRGYITKVEYHLLKEPGQEIDWMIRYYPGEEAKQSIGRILSYRHLHRPGAKQRVTVRTARPKVQKESQPAEQGIDQSLLNELTRRGITTKQAQRLLLALAPNQEVRDQLEWADYIVSQGSINNPPGLYVTFIKDNLTPPDSFETSRRLRTKRHQNRVLTTKQSEEETLALAYANYRGAEIDSYIASNPIQYKAVYHSKTQEALTKFSDFAAWKPDLADKFVTTLARAEIAKRVVFDTLETFRDRQQAPQPLLALPAPQQGTERPQDSGEQFLTV